MPVVPFGALDQYIAESLKQQLVAAMSALKSNHPRPLSDITTGEHEDASALQVLMACKATLKQGKLET